MGETQEPQLSPETCFTIHMGEPQEVQLTKIGNSTFHHLFIFINKKFHSVKIIRLTILRAKVHVYLSFPNSYSYLIFCYHIHQPTLCLDVIKG